MRWALILLFLSALSPAFAQPPEKGSQVQVDRILQGMEARYQAALIKERRLADDRELRAMQAADDNLRVARANYEANLAGAEQRLSAARDQYATLVASVASKDQQVKALVATYQAKLAGDLSLQSPEMLAAMQKFSDGDLVGGERAFAEERVRRTQARAEFVGAMERQARLADAADARQNARMLETMRVGGLSDLVSTLVAWNDAARDDPNDFWTHIERARLLSQLGRLPEAWDAAKQALTVAETSTERVNALIEMGDASWAGGYWDAARKSYQDAAQFAQANADTEPYTALIASERMVTTVYDQDQNTLVLLITFLQAAESRGIGATSAAQLRSSLPHPVLPSAENAAIAEQHLKHKLSVLENIAKDVRAQEPASAKFLRTQFSYTFSQLAYHYTMQSRWAEARELLEKSLPMDRVLLQEDPSASQKSGLSKTLLALGDANLMLNSLATATAQYSEAYEITRTLFLADPSNVDLGFQGFSLLVRLGAAAYMEKDFSRTRYYWVSAREAVDLISQAAPNARVIQSQVAAVDALLALMDAVAPE